MAAAMDFPSSPTTGQVYTAPGGGPSYMWNGTVWVATGSSVIGIDRAGFRNALINGGFDIPQRPALAAGTGFRYGPADRWIANSNGSTMAMSINALTLGQIPYEPRWFLFSNVASVANVANYAMAMQRIEGVRAFAGQQVTLSFWGGADANRPMSVELSQNFGTGGSPSAGVTGIGSTKFNVTPLMTRYSMTVTMPSIAGKTIGTAGDDTLDVAFWMDAGSNYSARVAGLGQQSGQFYLSQVQLEPGPVATPPEKRNLETEYAMCRRYYQAYAAMLMSGYAAAGQAFYQDFVLSTPMRATPTVALSGFGYLNSSAMALNAAYFNHVRLQTVITAAGFGYSFADVTLTAEL